WLARVSLKAFFDLIDDHADIDHFTYKRPQQTLHDRMLSRPELLGVFLAQPADDGECRQLRLRSEPALDRTNMWVELGRHANPGLIGPMGSPVRGTRLAGLHRLAERLRKNGCGRWRVACAGALQAARLSGTTIDTIAEFLLGCANLGQERDRIERAILIV